MQIPAFGKEDPLVATKAGKQLAVPLDSLGSSGAPGLLPAGTRGFFCHSWSDQKLTISYLVKHIRLCYSLVLPLPRLLPSFSVYLLVSLICHFFLGSFNKSLGRNTHL